MSPRRRRATVLTATTVLCATAAPMASAAAPAAVTSVGSVTHTASSRTAAASKSDKLPDGLYGTADPKYDGVWRQSMALLALDGAGAVPAKKAVDWLAGQQCGDGSFTAYRADAARTGKKCDPDGTPSDINATALALQALAAVGGRSDTVREGVEWLISVQNKDGGWGSAPRAASDANSTSLVIGALHTAGKDPEKATAEGGKSPYDALLSFQLTCESKGIENAMGQQGAFTYKPDKNGELVPNDDASAAASLAALGEGTLPEPPATGSKGGNGSKGSKDKPVTPLTCNAGKGIPGGREEAAGAGAAYLADRLKENGGHFSSVMPGADKEQPDYANTADAVIALAAGGHRKPAKASLKWLADNLDKWDKSKNDPAAISSLMLASRATGGDPAKLGGTNLLSRLNNTGPKPAKMPAADSRSDDDKDGTDSGGTIPVWAFILVGLAVGAGFGILLSGRRKRQQL
jgi:hypothetical protein